MSAPIDPAAIMLATLAAEMREAKAEHEAAVRASADALKRQMRASDRIGELRRRMRAALGAAIA